MVIYVASSHPQAEYSAKGQVHILLQIYALAEKKWADDPTRLSAFPSQWFPKRFR